ncbi:helix-turn-helix transcriptional regulator [Actinomadura sp. 7K507]|uniref:helix-turn-helix domain-containing protein n=1 Tax=Actinomadura sp. 7K507 TaxID=2530365 RepID=UPI00104CEDC8|nr:helix-turn-helix transcriptional regulator [Actinomadura sp. 7K507]TDC91230.1 XRE family transcriptional regulator [Actinomadura sp. 7K507]
MASSRDTNPSAYQEMFVNELRARREASGLSRNKLAAALGCTPQWIAKVETFEKPPSEGLADDLDTYFQTGGMFRRAWEKHVEARKHGLIPNAVRPLVDAEKEANQINIYEPLLVTGLVADGGVCAPRVQLWHSCGQNRRTGIDQDGTSGGSS